MSVKINKKELRKQVDFCLKWVFVFGVSCGLVYSMRKDAMEFGMLFYFCLLMAALGILSLVFSFNKKLKEKLVTKLWRKINK